MTAFYVGCSGGWVFVRITSSLHSVCFGQLLRCAHKRVVNIMKVYIERNNMRVELIRFRKKYRIIHVYFCGARNFPTDTMFTQRDRWICVIYRSRCATDGSVWYTDRAARLMDLRNLRYFVTIHSVSDDLGRLATASERIRLVREIQNIKN